nr:sigma-70 family RNA polymerase sigma factor [Bacilli bacterium]
MKLLDKEMKYKDFNDYELLSYIKEQNEEANEIIYEKYKPLIVSMAKKLIISSSNVGFDITDLIGEGMLGLANAIDTYDEVTDIKFHTYAKKCIENYMLMLIRKGTRLKNRCLTESISYDTDDTINMFKDNSINPFNIIVDKESITEIYKLAKDILSTYEYEVFKYKLDGFNYKEIAKILNKSSKEIDNTLYRIRNKLKKHK